MTFTYRALSPRLHETANAAISWFINKWGIKRSVIEVEASIDPDIGFRATFVARTDDFHILCAEVSENIYNNTLDSVVLDCREKGLPVKLFVAVPKDISDPNYAKKLRDAKRAGVGILEVDHSSGTIVQLPLSLSLAGVRPIESTDFPTRYRQSLQHAHQVFRDGDPNKACSLVYDELEAAFRRFAKKCVTKKFWLNSNNYNVDKDSWAGVITDLDRKLDRGHSTTRTVTPALMARLIRVTTHRNESGHKPRNLRDLKRRDQALRTRFEGAVDLLREFLDATKAFRI
jgi:hypothetical protein